jgi:hypothetical protein
MEWSNKLALITALAAGTLGLAAFVLSDHKKLTEDQTQQTDPASLSPEVVYKILEELHTQL